MNPSLVRAAAPLLLFFVFCAVPLVAQENPLEDVLFDPVVTGLDLPVSLAFSPVGPEWIYIVEQPGRVRLFDGVRVQSEPVVDVSRRVSCCGEDGLLGIALHPAFASNHWMYVYYVEPGDDSYFSVIKRYELSPDGRSALPGSEKEILRFVQPTFGHNAGQLRFGPDGLLYISVGDGGAEGRAGALAAQRLDTLLGKILRIDVDGGDPYGIPPANPLLGVEGARPEIFALGLRNPWRFSFDKETGDIWIGDVGSGRAEEIDRIPARTEQALNFGWPDYEGDDCSLLESDGCEDQGYQMPTVEILRSDVLCSAIVAGFRYRGADMPGLTGRFFFADWCSERLWAATETDEGWDPGVPVETGLHIASFGQDAAGEIYALGRTSGTIFRLRTVWPRPGLSVVSPATVTLGGEPFEMTVLGSAFHRASTVFLDDQPLETVFLDSRRLRAVVDPKTLGEARTALLSVRSPEPADGDSDPLELALEVREGAAPHAVAGGVVNAASFQASPLVPGQVVSIFGEALASTSEAATALPLPTSLGGATVRLSSGEALPLLFASPGQINFVTPWGLLTDTSFGLEVESGGARTSQLVVQSALVNPAVFTMNQSGTGQAAALISGTGALAAPVGTTADSRPVHPGEYVEIYTTGLGAVLPETPVDDAAYGALQEAVEIPAVFFGTVEAVPVFAGRAPGFVGLYQVNVQVPEQAPRGKAVRLVVAVRGVPSRQVSIAIE
ncbi:MAG: hypothetical protein GC160_01585 [Acidobacteria bacterium]|nr:hypothetical protein [Acidobacteriota bacterium]